MVFSTLYTSTTVNLFRNVVHFGHRRGFNGWLTGLVGAAGVMTMASASGTNETHDSRAASSDFYSDSFLAKYDNPVTKLPEYENGWHAHGPHSVQRKYGGGGH